LIRKRRAVFIDRRVGEGYGVEDGCRIQSGSGSGRYSGWVRAPNRMETKRPEDWLTAAGEMFIVSNSRSKSPTSVQSESKTTWTRIELSAPYI
jgi:hypothetical protein